MIWLRRRPLDDLGLEEIDLNLAPRDATAAASTERKTWIDPVLEEYDVEAVTEAGGPGVVDGGIFS